MSISRLLRDERYHDFVIRYWDNLPQYVLDHSRQQISWQQMDILNSITKPGCRTTIASGHGCFGIGTEIMMFDGSIKAVEQVVTGDALMGDDGTPRNVLDLARGRELMLRFEYDNGNSHIFNKSHILCLRDISTGKISEVPICRFVEWYCKAGGISDHVSYRKGGSGIVNQQIVDIEPLGEGDYYGFTLDGNHRFLGGDYTVLRNTGKSWLLGWTLDWHLRVFPNSNGLLTANNLEQTRIGVWKYLDEVMSDMDYCRPWMTKYFVKEAKKYFVAGNKDSWYFMPKTAGKSNPQGLAGQHAKHYMAVVDEASEVEDVKHDVIEGALTQERNRHVMVSQPTRISGRFADCFKAPLNAIYETFNLNAEESPLVDKTWISQQLAKYGGHHSPEYQIRVLGRFPDNLAGFLIPRQWWEQAANNTIHHLEPWGWIVTVDVAEGMFRDSSVWTIAKVSGYGLTRKVEIIEIYESLDRNELGFARELYQRIQTLPNVTIAVDADGCGRTVVLTLEELNVAVESIHWGLPPHSDADRKRYKNLRAFSAVKVREALFENRLRIIRNTKLMDQGAKIPYRLDEAGRYAIMPKEQMRSQGIKSPDLFDTVCFFYLVDYVPVSDGTNSVEKDAILQAALELLRG